MTITGHSPETRNLLISAVGGPGTNTDNFVSAEWNAAGYWIVDSRDTPGGKLQNLTEDNVAFSFAFFETRKVNIQLDSDAGTIAVDENRDGNFVDQNGLFRGEIPYLASEQGGMMTFTFGGDFVLEESDSVRCEGGNAISLEAAGDLIVPEGLVFDASATSTTPGPGGGAGGVGAREDCWKLGGAGGAGGRSLSDGSDHQPCCQRDASGRERNYHGKHHE